MSEVVVADPAGFRLAVECAVAGLGPAKMSSGRPLLDRVWFQRFDGVLHVWSSDSFVMVECRVDVDGLAVDGPVSVVRRDLKDLVRLLKSVPSGGLSLSDGVLRSDLLGVPVDSEMTPPGVASIWESAEKDVAGSDCVSRFAASDHVFAVVHKVSKLSGKPAAFELGSSELKPAIVRFGSDVRMVVMPCR